ncbi:Retinol dehydrogenase 14 [Dufourea novaeangliae]|uniref:Retinol dehydrogenase 14 n=1 Tax=Dufourea novaeangliae TaxID=178035 RepID=A0A154P7Q6_DUFNO|nr:Retinol dehydrogenase 14 [Dufourea novaeangliae]
MLLKIVSCTTLCYLATAASLGVLLLLLAVYFYAQYTLGICKSKTNMAGKTVIITGCTSGIGKETARDIAKRGARLIMACRNTDAANKLKGINIYFNVCKYMPVLCETITPEVISIDNYDTVTRANCMVMLLGEEQELIKESNNNNIIVRKLDLSLLSSVREFAEQINREENKLDVLIHNAGTAEVFRKKVTEDGLEMTMATNHYGPFLLTHLLIDLLRRSKPSRIVVVASSLYVFARVNLNNINPTTTLPGYLYYVSKYANIMFTLELARRLEGSGVTANCLHPGLMSTGIWKNVPPPMSWLVNFLLNNLCKTPEQGAQTTIHLATSEEVEGVSGKYFSDCRESSLCCGVADPSKGKKFWELSEGIVKLQPTDPKI